MATILPPPDNTEALVASELRCSNEPVAASYPAFSSSAERVWHAYYCLPRDEKGQPPAVRQLERAFKIAHGTLNKLYEGRAKLERTNHSRVERIARALETSVDWLLYERGAPPMTAWHVPPWPGPKEAPRSSRVPAAKRRIRE